MVRTAGPVRARQPCQVVVPLYVLSPRLRAAVVLFEGRMMAFVLVAAGHRDLDADDVAVHSISANVVLLGKRPVELLDDSFRSKGLQILLLLPLMSPLFSLSFRPAVCRCSVWISTIVSTPSS